MFKEAVASGVDLQLSGHTHVGQIPPMDFIVMLYYKYPYGLYNKNSSYLYTTSGTGTWGPPMRLFPRSEIVKIVLEQLK
jgi:predicted MPP superfamily phosphohydrolase